MTRVILLIQRTAIALLTAALLIPIGCNQFDERGFTANLKPGMNYLQPVKWRWTTRFRVQQVVPKTRLRRDRDSAINPGVPAVGKGTYEIWVTKPYEGEAMMNVKETYASPAPTKISKGDNTEAIFYYWDFTPDGHLPQELQAQVTWEFVTFEQYAYSPDYKAGAEYDKDSALYKEYTKKVSPYNYNPRMTPILKDCVTPGDEKNYLDQALKAYNYMCTKFVKDQDKLDVVLYGGLQGMTDAYRAFENQKGVCDEITNVYVSMLRHLGIPARPALGYVHNMVLDDKGNINTLGKPHAWAEFYLPDTGWVPVDATWGTTGQTIDPALSTLGAAREMGMGEYYFGHMDALRCLTYKDVGYGLQPPPKTPGAKKSEVWNLGYAERSSGVEKVVYGWKGVDSVLNFQNTKGWARSKAHEGYNFDIELTMLGPPSKAELEDLKGQLAERGINYVQVPPVKLNNLPFISMGQGALPPVVEEEEKEI